MLQKLNLQPGVFKDDPPLTVEGFWTDADLVRFYRGRAEKIGGWEKLSESQIDGKARGILSWSDTTLAPMMGIGTHTKLYVYASEQLVDITPYRSEVTLGTDPFSVTSGSETVTVTHTSHGASQGDTVHISGATAVGGITPDGAYVIETVPDSNSYTITHSSAATSTATGGGTTVAAKYEISIGLEYGSTALGWGAGGWGTGTWGTERDSTTVIVPRTWALSNWGAYMLANPYGGALYEWQGDTAVRAARVTNAPDEANFMFVTPERICVLLGTKEQVSGTFNPLLARWSDQEDITTANSWTALPTNMAGEQPLSAGSRLVAGTPSKMANLVWTDTALYSMRYLNDPAFVFGFDLLGTACGLIGPHAFAERDGLAFWMSPTGQFFMYDGAAPKAIPCPVRRYVFDNLRHMQVNAIWCALNSAYNEVWFWYAGDQDTNEISRYVAYNYVEETWTIGTMARTCWTDKATFEKPVAIGPDGYIYLHETGYDADGEAMDAYVQSAPFDLGDGELVMNVTRIVPDVDLTGTLDVTLTTRRWPTDVQEYTKNLSLDDTKVRIDTRVQGRQAALRFGVDSMGEWFRLGDVRLDMREGGKV